MVSRVTVDHESNVPPYRQVAGDPAGSVSNRGIWSPGSGSRRSPDLSAGVRDRADHGSKGS